MTLIRYAVAVCLLMTGVAQATDYDLGAIWFIGDSITQSNADGDSNGSPRKSLYDLLTANGYTFTYTGHFTANVDGLPTTGSTASDNLYHYHSGVSGIKIGEKGVTNGFAFNMTTYWDQGRLAVVKPDNILIMLGTNDVATPDGATNRLSKLVQDVFELPNVGDPTIFLATIPPNGRSASDTAFVAAFNAEVPGIVSDFQAAGKDVRFVDQFTPLNDDYAANMQSDNLHPNATGNDTMAQTWFDAIFLSVNTVTVSGVSTNIDAAYGSFASSTDLVNSGSSSLAGTPIYSDTPFFGPAENDGAVGAANSGADITFWLGASAGSTYSITYDLNTSSNIFGYDIISLQTIHGWTDNSGNQKNQNYEVDVSTVGDSGFMNIATVAYLPFSSEETTGSTKVTVADDTGILASGVDQIRFTYTIPASGGANPSPTIREIDVFGEATIPFTVTGVSTNIDAAYGSFASASDLVNAGSATLASGPTYSTTPNFGPSANNDGTVGGSNISDITFWMSASAGNTYSISYALDTSVNSLGYDITSLQTIHGWSELSGNQKNQNYTVDVSMVGDSGFTNIATVAYFPFPDPPNTSVAGSSMVTVSNEDTGILASGVDEIRFTYTVPASGGSQPSPTIREIDVFGEATTVEKIYIGDAAAEGTNVTSGTESYSLTTLTIVMHTDTAGTYTAPSNQSLKLREVNFYTDATGTVTPFIARYDGSNSTLGSGYEILAIGDAFSVTDGTDHLENRAFTVGGLNPTISVSSGDQIVAGFLEAGGRVVRLVSDTTGVADYIYSGDSVTSQSVGDPLSANSSYNFDRSMKFNIGFEVLPAVPIVPTSPDGTVIFFH